MSLQTNTASLTALLESVNALPDKVDTSGTATAADIYTGKTATVNDAKLTGTNPYNAATVDPQVTSILTALTEKGVDTTGAGLSDIAGLVESIQAGGGGGVKAAAGTFTPSSTISAEGYTINHGLGETPVVAVVFIEPLWNSISSDGLECAVLASYSEIPETLVQHTYCPSGYGYVMNQTMLSETAITLSKGDKNVKLLSGQKYFWYVVGQGV